MVWATPTSQKTGEATGVLHLDQKCNIGARASQWDCVTLEHCRTTCDTGNGTSVDALCLRGYILVLQCSQPQHLPATFGILGDPGHLSSLAS